MRRWLALIVLIALLVASLQLAAFVQASRPLVDGLAARVQATVQARQLPYVPLKQIPDFCNKALIDTEDRSFWTNGGVDLFGILRAVVTDLITGTYAEGGSTLTQQLARDQLLTLEKTIRRKVKEIILAVMITRHYSKEQILEMYWNQVYLGHDAYGIADAARTYFAVTPSGLTDGQCALIAGIPQAPSLYDPLAHLDAAKDRQTHVLRAMVDAGDLTQAQANQVASEPLYLLGQH